MAEPLRRRVRARVLRALTGAAGFLPEGILGVGLDTVARLASRSSFQRTILANLERALGSETDASERERIAQGVRLHSARLFREWIALARSAPPAGTDPKAIGPHTRWIDERVTLDDSYEIMQREHARGRGVLVLTAHIGNWELLAARLHREGYPGVVIGKHRARDSSSDWLIDMRRAYGVTTMPQDAPARDLLRVLQRGEVIGMLADLEARRLAGDFLPFFGTPALCMTAPAALARTRRIPLVPARCIAVGPREYRLSFEEPLRLNEELERGDATLELTRRLFAIYERWIRETAEQWAWHQPRWRTQPGSFTPIPVAERNRRAREVLAEAEDGSSGNSKSRARSSEA